MVVKRFWRVISRNGSLRTYTGWFLLGLIPIYIKQERGWKL